MSEAKFTKGPWKSHDHDEMDIVSESESFVGICTVYGYEPDHTGFNVSDECSANAHLIAAAPEMYQAIENLLVELDAKHGISLESMIGVGLRRCLEDAYYPLAKARGEV